MEWWFCHGWNAICIIHDIIWIYLYDICIYKYMIYIYIYMYRYFPLIISCHRLKRGHWLWAFEHHPIWPKRDFGIICSLDSAPFPPLFLGTSFMKTDDDHQISTKSSIFWILHHNWWYLIIAGMIKFQESENDNWWKVENWINWIEVPSTVKGTLETSDF